LGYTDPVIEDNNYEYKEKISFSNYRELQKQKQKEQDEQTEEKQQEREAENVQNAETQFDKHYENSDETQAIKNTFNNMSEEDQQEALNMLENTNEVFDERSNKVNGLSFNSLNVETQKSVVTQSTENVKEVNLGLSDKLNER